MEDVNSAVLEFQASSLSCHRKTRKGDSHDLQAWSGIKNNIFKELNCARERYKCGYLKQSKIGDAIRSIKRDISYYFFWLEWLPEDEHRFSLCSLSTLKSLNGQS